MEQPLISPVSAKNKSGQWSYIILSISFITLIGVSLFLLFQIQKTNAPIATISTPTIGITSPTFINGAVPTSPPKLTPEELAKIPLSFLNSSEGGFTTKYPSNYKLNKENLTTNIVRYTMIGSQILVTITSGNEQTGINPSIGEKGATIIIDGVTGYLFGTGTYYRIDFKNKDKFYTFECANLKSSESRNCSIIFDNLKFIK